MQWPPADIHSATGRVDADDVCAECRQGGATERRRDEGGQLDYP